MDILINPSSLDAFTGSSRVWCFHAERALAPAEAEQFTRGFDAFIRTWAAHGAGLFAGYQLRYGQFIVVAVDQTKMPPSGCSIDKMARTLMELGNALDIEILNAPEIAFRDAGGAVGCLGRAQFAALAQAGGVTADTVVFDETIQDLDSYRAGKWEVPAAQAWHAKAFRL